MAVTDAVAELVHDHADINRQIIALAALIPTLTGTGKQLAPPLGALRELVFLHFAREEEGLFPFVAETVPDLADQVHAMASAHDTICGALARMYHLAASNAELGTIALVFQRFEAAYGAHARTEAELLGALSKRLDDAQRARLAAIVEGL